MESLINATEDCRAMWQTTWPQLPPRDLEAVATPGWGQFLMNYPRASKNNGNMSEINLYRIV
eukprot:845456-Karenia_brevis.AAC.1